MSRHELDGREPGTRIVVGWDPPLLTYFVHVFDGRADEGPSVWLGGAQSWLRDLADLRRAVQPFTDLPDELAHRLQEDRDEDR